MKYYRLLLVCGLLVLPLFSTPLQNVMMPPVEDSTLYTYRDSSGTEQYSIEFFDYGFYIEVVHAYYYDLDSDGLDDDVYTIITIYTLNGYAESVCAEIYQYLTLPSGLTYYFPIDVIGYDDSYSIYTEWYNVATEPGWYTMTATVTNFNFFGFSYDEDTVIFDPPETAPNSGTPTVDYGIY